jgi:CRISPR-associated endonuclease Csn1
MDALTIAFTKHNHIQYLNHLNARKDEASKFHKVINAIEQKETELYIDSEGKKKRKFKPPVENFREVAKNHLENVLISFKAKNKVATKNKNKTKSKKGDRIKVELTPRGQLHKETVYGRSKQYKTREEKISAKFDEHTILKIANANYRFAILQRLKENGNDLKKAFTGKNALNKNPIYVDCEKKVQVPEKIKLVWLEDDFTIRKDVTPDLKIEKVVDVGVRKILQSRLDEFNGAAKEAFSNLDKNPIWLNKEKGIAIKRVTISGVKNAEALHTKKDHLGKDILDKNGNKMPADFVSTGNNHHVAIYRDENGDLQEKVISFYEAVERINQGLPVIDKTFNQGLGWQFLFTMKQNEMFVFPFEGFDPKEIDLKDSKNNRLISPNLFRVQTLSIVQYGNATIRDFKFRHHLETKVEDRKDLQKTTYIQLKSLEPLKKIIKVRINHLGQIVKVGEY